MIARLEGRRLSITLFAVLFFAAALLSFVDAPLRLPEQPAAPGAFLPWRSRDGLILWHSAWASIALVPIAMIWLSALCFARAMVSLMALAKLAGLLIEELAWAQLVAMQPLLLGSLLLALSAVGLRFTPASNPWFARKQEGDLARIA
jgi:hypothetical protein